MKSQSIGNYYTYEFDVAEIDKFIEESVEDIYFRITNEPPMPQLDIFYHGLFRVNWEVELMYQPFTPKEPISSFASKGGSIFMSKKKPLLIVCNLANEMQSELALKYHSYN